MASNKNALAMCDTCGFVYAHRIMKLNSYNMVTCPECWDGAYDFKNHPQNKVPDVRDDVTIRNPRPDIGGRNLEWQNVAVNWEDEDKWWQTIWQNLQENKYHRVISSY